MKKTATNQPCGEELSVTAMNVVLELLVSLDGSGQNGNVEKESNCKYTCLEIQIMKANLEWMVQTIDKNFLAVWPANYKSKHTLILISIQLIICSMYTSC